MAVLDLAPTPQLSLIEHLQERAQDANQHIKRREYDQKSFFASNGPAHRMPHLILGNLSSYDPLTCTKFIDWTVWPWNPVELARPYLRWIHDAQRTTDKRAMLTRRVPWRNEQLPMLDISHPYYYAGGRFDGDYAYVDITAAYHQLYSVATLDLDFDPNRELLGVGRIEFLRAGELGESKALRNNIMGVCRSQTVNTMKYGVSRTSRSHNTFLAPQLWGYVAYTLHALMREVIERFGAVYVHTDGVIVPQHRAADLLRWLADEWRIKASVKAEGEGHVRALGAYKIGAHETANFGDRDGAGSTTGYLLDLDTRMHRLLREWRHWLLDRSKHEQQVAPTNGGQLVSLPAQRLASTTHATERAAA